MYKIYKYTLEITDIQEVYMPQGSIILSVINQNEELQLYARVDTSKPLEERRIGVIGTGNPISDDQLLMKFLGTVSTYNGSLVWHVVHD